LSLDNICPTWEKYNARAVAYQFACYRACDDPRAEQPCEIHDRVRASHPCAITKTTLNSAGDKAAVTRDEWDTYRRQCAVAVEWSNVDMMFDCAIDVSTTTRDGVSVTLVTSAQKSHTHVNVIGLDIVTVVESTLVHDNA
jgi:ribose 1,5-bisphosphokinase PhnN